MDTTESQDFITVADLKNGNSKGMILMAKQKKPAKATVAIGGYLKSADVVQYMVSRFGSQGYNETTFRNDLNAKKIKHDKKEGKTLLFNKATMDGYARLRAEVYAKKTKTKGGPVNQKKSPDLTTFGVPIYKNHLSLLISVGVTEEQLRAKLKGVIDDVINKVQSKLSELKTSIEL